MAAIEIKRFGDADETRPFKGHGHLDLVRLGGNTVGCAHFEPGWRWSTDVGPIAGTKTCEVRHLTYVLSGRLHVRMDDGEETDIQAGDLAAIEPGHDAWVVGDAPCVLLDFVGFEDYAKEQPTRWRAREPEALGSVH